MTMKPNTELNTMMFFDDALEGERTQLLTELAASAMRAGSSELARLSELAGGALGPADVTYWLAQERKANASVDLSAFTDYCELDRVLNDGVFYAAGVLYGLRFSPRPDLHGYHPDVRVFEVREADGARDVSVDGPFDVIVLSGSVAEVPARLLAQLSDRGRLLAITGQEPVMRVTLVRRKGDRFEVSYPWDVNAARLQHFEEPSTFQF